MLREHMIGLITGHVGEQLLLLDGWDTRSAGHGGCVVASLCYCQT